MYPVYSCSSAARWPVALFARASFSGEGCQTCAFHYLCVRAAANEAFGLLYLNPPL